VHWPSKRLYTVLMYNIAVYRLVNGGNAHKKQQISGKRYHTAWNCLNVNDRWVISVFNLMQCSCQTSFMLDHT